MKTRLLVAFALFLTLNGFAQEQSACTWDVPKNVMISETSTPDYAVNITCSCPLKDVKITVFNRWGMVLYTTNLLQHVWMGKETESGVYMMKLEGIYKDGTTFSELFSVNYLR